MDVDRQKEREEAGSTVTGTTFIIIINIIMTLQWFNILSKYTGH